MYVQMLVGIHMVFVDLMIMIVALLDFVGQIVNVSRAYAVVSLTKVSIYILPNFIIEKLHR